MFKRLEKVVCNIIQPLKLQWQCPNCKEKNTSVLFKEKKATVLCQKCKKIFKPVW